MIKVERETGLYSGTTMIRAVTQADRWTFGGRLSRVFALFNWLINPVSTVMVRPGLKRE